MIKKKLFVSNLCWGRKNNIRIIKHLNNEKISGIDFAPLNYFNSWSNIIENSKKLKKIFNNHNIEINSIQGIFYKKRYNFFDIKNRRKITNHFKLIIKLCKIFKANKIILGSSKFRNPKNLKLEKANLYFINYFKYLSKLLKKNNILLCIETIPKNYKEKFIFDISYLTNLISRINSPNIGINFDTSIYHFQKFDKNKFLNNKRMIKNIQISERNFNYFDEPSKKNLAFIKLLKKQKQFNKISLEIIDKKCNEKKFLFSIKNFKKINIF